MSRAQDAGTLGWLVLQPELRPNVGASEFSTLTCRAADLSSYDPEFLILLQASR